MSTCGEGRSEVGRTSGEAWSQGSRQEGQEDVQENTTRNKQRSSSSRTEEHQVETQGSMTMAKGRTYTLRGCFPWKSTTQATVMEPVRVPLWNGSWTDNWVVDKV
jgi:hypothetical protein